MTSKLLLSRDVVATLSDVVLGVVVVVVVLWKCALFSKFYPSVFRRKGERIIPFQAALCRNVYANHESLLIYSAPSFVVQSNTD